MNESQYEMIIYWDKRDEIFVVDIPELAGCMAHGKTKKEAIDNAEAAINLWVEMAKEDNIIVPEPKGRLLFA
jgi:predicted RNase H-like HicB family nuclease